MVRVEITLGLISATVLSFVGGASSRTCSLIGDGAPPIDEIGKIAQGGTVAVLGFVVWILLGELKDNRAERREVIGKFTEALTQLREHCASRSNNDKAGV